MTFLESIPLENMLQVWYSVGEDGSNVATLKYKTLERMTKAFSDLRSYYQIPSKEPVS